ncbi:MAG TPA: hypothetical protein VFD57_08430, partial [Clostridia bacterium]|nr:hypothetical protein [Clostridia bacterium]
LSHRHCSFISPSSILNITNPSLNKMPSEYYIINPMSFKPLENQKDNAVCVLVEKVGNRFMV